MEGAGTRVTRDAGPSGRLLAPPLRAPARAVGHAAFAARLGVRLCAAGARAWNRARRWVPLSAAALHHSQTGGVSPDIGRGRRWLPSYVIACATLLLSAGLLNGLGTENVPITHPLQGLPDTLGSWRGETDYFDPDIVAALHVDDYVLRRYQTSTTGTMWLYVGYWGAQRLGQERVHSPSVCLPGAGWVIARSGVTPIRLGSRTIVVNSNLIQKDDLQQVVVYWYQIHGQVVAKELPATATLAWTALTERHSDEALVRINTVLAGSVNATIAREISFVQAAFPALSRLLPN